MNQKVEAILKRVTSGAAGYEDARALRDEIASARLDGYCIGVITTVVSVVVGLAAGALL